MSLRTMQHPVNHRGIWPHRLVFDKRNLIAFLSFFALLLWHLVAIPAATTITPESLYVRRAEIENAPPQPHEHKKHARGKKNKKSTNPARSSTRHNGTPRAPRRC